MTSSATGPPALLDPDPETSDACHEEIVRLTQQCEVLENHLSSENKDYDATFELLRTTTARLNHLETLYPLLLDRELASRYQTEEWEKEQQQQQHHMTSSVARPPPLLDPDPKTSDACHEEFVQLTRQCEFLENHLFSETKDYDATFELLRTATARRNHLETLYHLLLGSELASRYQTKELEKKQQQQQPTANASLSPPPSMDRLLMIAQTAQTVVPASECVMCHTVQRPTCVHKI
jgi:ribosomal protein S15P/S13E